MKYRAKQYARALYEVLKEKKEKEHKAILRNFLSLLRVRREWSRITEIIREYEKYYLTKERLRKVRVTSAHELSDTTRTRIREAIESAVYWEEVVRPELLGGVSILLDDEILVDASIKRQLENMFTP